MSGGSIDVHSLSTTGMGYDAEGGTLVITGGETVINGEQDCYTVLITANGDASVTVAGGTHSIEGKGGMNGFMAGDASEIRFTDGTIHMHPVNPEPGATSNGIYLAGGTMEMSGGSLTLESELISGGTLVGTAAGSLSITGGEMHLSSITPIQYGMNVPYGTVSVQGLTMTVSVPGGTAGGFTATYHEGTLTLISGDFTISGDVATPGRGYTAAHPIENGPASADCAFSLYYRSGWSSGENFRYAPYIRETVEMRGMMASAKDGRLGEFVSSGKMHLFLDTELAAVIPVKAGIWEVNVPGEGSVLAEIRTAGAEGNIETDPILIGSASQLFISGDESFDPGFRSKKPVLLRKLVKTGRRKGFPGVALTLPETEARTYGCALPAEAETPLVLQCVLNEAGEAVLIRVGRTEAVHESETESQNASETMDEPEKIPEETGQKEGGESV